MRAKSSGLSVRLQFALVLAAAALATAMPTAVGALGQATPVAGGSSAPCCGGDGP
jgi:hypothetical protein